MVPTREGESLVPTVRLLHATRLLAQHGKLVRAQVEGPPEKALALFESEKLPQQGVVVEDGAVELDDSGSLILTIQNYGLAPICLEEGLVLGRLQPGEVLPRREEGMSVREPAEIERRSTQPEDTPLAEVSIATVTVERQRQLLEAVHIDEMDLPSEQCVQLCSLLEEYADVFALNSSELGYTDLVSHTIDTNGHPPIRQAQRRIPFALREKVEGMVEEVLERGVVQLSKSPWASPVVLVAKKDGTTRFCVDYQRLNASTKLDVFPLPRIDDSLDLLAHSQYFTTLDLASGYWQVGMDDDSREKTAFVTHSGLFEFLVMPFGLCNAPATFQRLMETVLAGLARDRCLVYIDDILVVGKTYEEHLENLCLVLARLRQAGLRLKPTKCCFLQRQVEYLGYVVSGQGISADPQKVYAYPVPADLRSLRSFLGLASYYRRFVAGFSKVAGPLFTLIRKDSPFVWSPACQEAFDALKRILTEAPVLAFPDFSKEFLLETDASGAGLGAVLAQKQNDGGVRPIAFASRTLQPPERNYGITELEGLGVVWAVKHFRHYLYGHHCKVFTDHEALKSLLNTPQPSGKLARWGLALQELDLEIHYRPGRVNQNADALSRSPVTDPHSLLNPSEVIATISAPETSAKEGDATLGEKQRSDPQLRRIIDYLTQGVLPQDHHQARELALSKSQYKMIDDVLYYIRPDKTLRVIPPTSDREKLFQEAHEGAFGGHLRGAKIHSELFKHYWWPSMRTEILKWCRGCLVCASRRIGQQERPPLAPIPVAGPFDKVGVDVLQLPKSYDGNRYAVVFVDYLTKWPEVFATADQSALTIAKLLVEHVISRHGVPAEVLSDRGASFLSNLMQEVCRLMGIKKVNTTAHHPQTDGLVERYNRTLIDMLAKTVDKSGQNWDTRLPYVLFAYRASKQESTRESPFYPLYGRDPRLPTEAALSTPLTRAYIDTDDYKTELTLNFTEAWDLSRQQVEKAQRQQKRFYDRRSRKPTFRVGDRVFLYMPAAKTGQAYKFARPYHGPYRVLEVVGCDASVVHVDQPQDTPLFVAIDRLRHCPDKISPGATWPPLPTSKRGRSKATPPEPEPDDLSADGQPEEQSEWTGRGRLEVRRGTCSDWICLIW